MMEGKTLARIGAIVFVAVAITATAVEMTRKEEAPIAAVAAAVAAADPLRADLTRCQLLGDAAEHDPACLRTWAENRARFLGTDRPAGNR